MVWGPCHREHSSGLVEGELQEPRLVERRRVLNGTVSIATSRREYTLLARDDGEEEGEGGSGGAVPLPAEVVRNLDDEWEWDGTTGGGRPVPAAAEAAVPAPGPPPQLQPPVVPSPLRADGSVGYEGELVHVRSGWLDMKVREPES